MIRFFRTTDCPNCDNIQETLEKLCIVHEIVNISSRNENQHLLPHGKKPPVLIDDKQIFEGYETIMDHLDELEGFAELWRKYQSDACYCDEKGQVQ